MSPEKSANNPEQITTMVVEVAYALPKQQKIITVNVPQNCTVFEAVQRSKITDYFPEINLENAKLGIFGKVVLKDQVLKPYDRVEIYRPLLIDPKEVRRKRAEKTREESDPNQTPQN